ncbi:tryptophan-rich sensory protein [Rhodococcus ruber]|uniref:TspO/MBR family protein n=1 Tax=Rhodococcus ruber TaxID=1830 RepID=UPI00387DC632
MSSMFGRTLLGTTAATAATAVAGSIASQDVDTRWYRRLRKPSFQPPGAVFPVVWTALYADIAVSSAVAIDELESEARVDEATYYRAALAVNLVLNASWSWVFFKAHRLVPATVVAGALAVSSADLARRAAVAKPAAGAALGPYAVWCAFATVLSGRIARLNRS